jgi:hypothetical protein
MQRRTVLVALGALLIAAVIAVTTAVFVWRTAKKTIVETVLKPEEKQIDIATLVTQVRELNRLETASMRVMHVGTITQTYKMVPNALGGDEITFLATGDVIAGIDLGHLRPEDVWRSPDGTINMRLPPSQILVSRVDNEQSRVLTRKTGVLRRADIDLETRARQRAEQNIRAEALKRGILKTASDSGEKKMAELLRTLGFMRIRFVQSPARPESS